MGCSIDPNPKPLSRDGGGADPDALTSEDVIADNTVLRGDGGDRSAQDNPVWAITDAGDLIQISGTAGTASVHFDDATDRARITGGGAGSRLDLYAGTAANLCLVRLTGSASARQMAPVTGSLLGLGSDAEPWATTFTNGLALEYVETAAAQYTADAQDHTIVLTAATAELVLPPAADGKQKYLVQFTGASSRTVTPDSGTSDTVDVSSPTQNKHYWVQSDGVSHWKMVLMD
jgi:hypothetical protein